MKSSLRSRPAQCGLAALALFNFAQAGVMAQGASRAYFANDPLGRDVVTITSNAPLETMLTRTGHIEADIKINPNNVFDNPRARFEIDAGTLETGIKLRDEHMKSADWLDTAKYPRISFTLTQPLADPRVSLNQAAKPGAKGEMPVEGELEFHGVKKTVQANVEIQVIGETEATKERLPGEMMHIKADFPLNLEEFGVKIPEMARLKVANIQQVRVDVFVSTGSKAPKWSAPLAQTGIQKHARRLLVQGKNGVRTHFGIGPAS